MSNGWSYVNFGLYQIYLHLSHHTHRVAGAKMAAAHERFKFSLWSTSNDHYIKRNDSSSPILPTINDIHCEIGNTRDNYSCTVYALQFQNTLQRGWLKHSNRVQIALACRYRVSCIHAARVAAYLWWQLRIVCVAVLNCSHLLLAAGGNLPPQLLQVQCSVMLCTV